MTRSLWSFVIRFGEAMLLLFLMNYTMAAARAEVLIFKTVDVAYDSSPSIPPLGWASVTTPLFAESGGSGKAEAQPLWIKLTFDRKQLPDDTIAISFEQPGGSIDAFLNDVHVFQNSASSIDQSFALPQPILFNIPDSSLRSGDNNLVLRFSADSNASLIADGIQIGSADEIRRDNQQKYFTRYVGPIMVSAILAFVGIFLFLFRFISRREVVLPWLGSLSVLSAIVSASDVVRYLSVRSEIAANINVLAMLLFVPAAIGLTGAFYGDPRRRIFVYASAGAALVVFGLRSVIGSVGDFSVLTCIVAAVAVCTYCFSKAVHAPQSENLVGLLGISAGTAGFLLDITANSGIWPGIGFALLPYCLLIAIGAFGIAVAQRFAKTLKLKEDENAKLGMRIETTKANLMVSENARRVLEISNAVTSERERLMREIHDGIGSSLMAALASAERQGKESSTAVVALKNALTDLRIAVDSLEPVEGNVATLLANLRYRIEPEMRKSGIAFEWNVDDVPELDWLDAPNALHILRIFQETLGNTFGHANATIIRVSCNLHMSAGRPGIAIEVSDNGRGFDPERPPQGRGRNNMLQRAEALGGQLTIESSPGKGSSVKLWLPLVRR